MPSPPLDFETGTLRVSTGCINSEPGQLLVLETSNELSDESWALIKYVIHSANNWSLTSKQKSVAEALITRSKMFYEKYQLTLEDPSSILLAYYFAINLAKALLCMMDSSAIGSEFYHGVSFKKQYIETRSQGRGVQVFPRLYKELLNTPLPNTSIKVDDLVGSVREYGLQSFLLKIQNHILGLSFVVPTNEGEDQGWLVIRLPNIDVTNLHSNKTMLRNFNKFFEKVELSPNQRSEMFRESGFESYNLTYFQSKEIFPMKIPVTVFNDHIERIIKAAFNERATINIFDKKIHYDIAMPVRGKAHFLNSEFFSLYLAIFWASSVVRYDPTLNLIGDKYSRERMIFDEVKRSAPYLLLRHFCSLFMKSNVELVRRG